MDMESEIILRTASTMLEGAERMETVQEVVRTAARRLVGADGATFVLRDGDRCFYADEDAMSPLWKGQRFPLTDCISGWAMLHDEAVAIPDIHQDDRIPIEAYRPTFVKSLVMVPIGRGGPVGAIGAYWATLDAPTASDVAALAELADLAALAIARVGTDGLRFLPATLRDAAATTA
jgi:GAF domain-containing protein